MDYNLYNFVLNKKHHKYREFLDYDPAEDFASRNLSYIERITERFEKMCAFQKPVILENFNILKNSGKDFIIRTPLIPNITDTEQNLKAIKNIVGSCKWEKLKYNEFAGAKYSMLNMEYPLKGI